MWNPKMKKSLKQEQVQFGVCLSLTTFYNEWTYNLHSKPHYRNLLLLIKIFPTLASVSMFVLSCTH